MKSTLPACAALAMLLSGCEALMFGNVIVGCAMRPTPEVLPRELPVATVGEPYSVQIEVINASTPLGNLQVTPDKPLPDGLELVHDEREKHAVIQGTPRAAGRYEVQLHGWTYGTQCTGQDIDKLYRLEVR